MNATRLVALGTVVLTIGLAVLGWFIGVSPILAQASQADQQTQVTLAENGVQASILAQLKDDYARIDEARDELETLRVGIPAAVRSEELTSLIGAYASAAGAVVTAISIGGGSPYGDATAEPTAADPAAAAAADPAPSSAQGLFSVPVSVTVQGDLATVLAFAKAMQEGGRIVLVDTLRGADSAGVFQLDLSGFAFVIPAIAPAPDVPAPTDTPAP